MPKRTSLGHAGGDDNLFVWTVFIIVLALFAAACWIGSFYVFGHPENAFSYRVLRSLGKVDPPKRFKLTAAPRGQFLDADKLLERYGDQSPAQLDAASDLLLRNYLRNYYQSKDRVPYVTGSFNIMGVFRLGPNNFVTSGVVALARSTDNPSLLLEIIFPAEEKNVGNLERMLQTGLDLTLARTLDLTAVINARRLPDGRLNLTAVPLLYGSYTSTDDTGTFSLEPPVSLNVSAGLPVLNQAAVEKAEQYYAGYLERAGLADESSAPALMRVQKTEAANPETAPVPATPPPGTTEMMDGVPVARAVAVDTAGEDVPVARAEPAGGDLPAPIPAPAAALEPFTAATPPTAAPSPESGARNWTLYDAGRMPRGRLLDANAARNLAGQGAPADPVYLSGEFSVAGTGGGRAILRGRRAPRNVRIIADFPAGATPPAQGQTFRRDSSRPFRIDRVEEGADGFVNVYVREVTRP